MSKTKRIIDVVVSSVALMVLWPLILLVALLVALLLGRPVFFKQVRPGLQTRPFTMIKFRTMLDLKDNTGNLLADNLRTTRFGNFLRSTSLDELPELWNVVKGEMSLVGPRPLLMRYLPLYSERQLRRHEVRPGVTGWAQVNGRNALNWDQKFELDVWYVENQSFLLDVKILAKTVVAVFSRSGINNGEGVTMPPFTGNSQSSPEAIKIQPKPETN